MEEDKLKDLFGNFNPELPSEFSFMAKLNHNLDRVEMIKKHNTEVATRRKMAVVIAACVGFIAGFLFSLTLPYLGNVMANLQASLPSESTFRMLTDHYLTVAWLIIGGATAFISLNAYDLSLSLMKHRQEF